MLQSVFNDLCGKYSSENELIIELWNELETNYSEESRYYHTLNHLQNLLIQLEEVKPEINNWDAILFSLFYHDVVYNASNYDNEEKSAELAKRRMRQLNVPSLIIDVVEAMILATKTHTLSKNNDTNLFTDADLSILGSDWETYSEYAKNVRKEYSIYPDLIYKPGRKKVLQHFLDMDRIFKTDYFCNKFEMQARENLQRELNG